MRFEGLFSLANPTYGCKESRVLDFTFRIQRDLRIDGIREKEIAKHGEGIKESRFEHLYFEKTQRGQRVDYKGSTKREPGQRHSKQEYQETDRTKKTISSETEKVTERMASRWMTVWRLDTRRLKAIRRKGTQSR